MTDGQGRTVNFKNTIIVMTSNIGQEIIRENLLCGYVNDAVVQMTTDAVMAQMKARVAPEFVNRIDEIVMFLPLTRDEISQIVRLQLTSLAKRLANRGLSFLFNDSVVSFLAEKSYIPEFGARPVKRAIDEYVVNALSVKLLTGSVDKAKSICASAVGGMIEFANKESVC